MLVGRLTWLLILGFGVFDGRKKFLRMERDQTLIPSLHLVIWWFALKETVTYAYITY